MRRNECRNTHIYLKKSIIWQVSAMNGIFNFVNAEFGAKRVISKITCDLLKIIRTKYLNYFDKEIISLRSPPRTKCIRLSYKCIWSIGLIYLIIIKTTIQSSSNLNETIISHGQQCSIVGRLSKPF